MAKIPIELTQWHDRCETQVLEAVELSQFRPVVVVGCLPYFVFGFDLSEVLFVRLVKDIVKIVSGPIIDDQIKFDIVLTKMLLFNEVKQVVGEKDVGTRVHLKIDRVID